MPKSKLEKTAPDKPKESNLADRVKALEDDVALLKQAAVQGQAFAAKAFC